MSCGCEQVSGLFSDGELYLNTEMMAGILVGAVVADYADQYLNKVEFLAANATAREGVKIAAGFALTQFGMPILDGIGYGMIAAGGARIIKGLMNPGAVEGMIIPGQEGTQPYALYGLNMPGEEGTQPNVLYGQKEKVEVNLF